MGSSTIQTVLTCLHLFLLLLRPLQVDSVRNIKIGFLPSMTTKTNMTPQNTGKTYAGAISVAIEALQNNSDYDHLNFTYVYKDTRFDSELTLKAIVDLYHENVDVFFGPESGCVISAKLASSLNRPMMGYRCLDSVLSNKSKYATFARTVPSTARVSKSILALFSYYNWNSFSVVMEETAEWTEVSSTLGLAAKKHGITINTNDSLPVNFNEFTNDHLVKIREIVRKSSNQTRIYILLGAPDWMVAFMRYLSYEANMSLYTVIHVRGFNDDFNYTTESAVTRLTHTWFDFMNNTVNETVNQNFRQLITLLHRRGKHDNQYLEFEERVRYYMVKPPFNVIALPGVPLPISAFSAKLYDGVMLYAKAVKEVLELGENPRDGRLLMSYVLNSSFQSIVGFNDTIDQHGLVERAYSAIALVKDDLSQTGIMGFNDTIDQHGDAEGAYSAVALVKDDLSETGWSLKKVGTFSHLSEAKLEYVEIQPMSWLGGAPPLSEPECGFDGSGCPEDPVSQVIALAAVISTSLVVVLTLLGVCYWRQHQQKKRVDSLLWKIEKEEINLVPDNAENIYSVANNTEEVECTERLLRWEDDNISCESELSWFGRRKKPSIASRGWPMLDEDEEERAKPELPYYCAVGIYKQMEVSLKCIIDPPEITKSAKEQLYLLREMNHENINKFVGACIVHSSMFIVHQYCSRGSLLDVLQENRDWFLEETAMQYSLINDLVNGMKFIHSSPIGFHGTLRSSKCLVDSRFVLQISGFGLHHFRPSSSSQLGEKYWKALIWTAPELLRQPVHPRGTQKGDVYSFGIILQEILALDGPWGGSSHDYRAIVKKVEQGLTPPMRPDLSKLNIEDYLKECIEECWAETPEARPDFKTLQSRKLKPLKENFGSSSILENMLQRIEKYTKNLEGLVEERTHQLDAERKRTEKLLHRMLPRSVAEELKKGKKVQANYYECVTICFSDIVGFTKLCAESDPYQIVSFLNDLYTRFDEIINNYDVYKVETIGDAYMVASGLPKCNGDNHAGEIASMSLHLQTVLKNFKIRHRPGEKLELRIGIHSGPVVVGVVGIKMPRYCLFGDTVNTTSRMESNGLPSRVHCSTQCKSILDKLGGYYLEKRGMVTMKGKGEVLTYWLTGEDNFYRIRRLAEAAVIESGCNSTRSSFDSLYLMPNGFRKPNKLTREQFSLEEFKCFRPASSTPSSLRKNIRRGSMPVNDNRRGNSAVGHLDIYNRRGSIPLNQLRTLDTSQEWQLNEDDERKTSAEFHKTVRTSPEGCDSEPEANSRRSSRKEMEFNNNQDHVTNGHVSLPLQTVVHEDPEFNTPTIIVQSPSLPGGPHVV